MDSIFGIHFIVGIHGKHYGSLQRIEYRIPQRFPPRSTGSTPGDQKIVGAHKLLSS
jgi:hypothetical protein